MSVQPPVHPGLTPSTSASRTAGRVWIFDDDDEGSRLLALQNAGAQLDFSNLGDKLRDNRTRDLVVARLIQEEPYLLSCGLLTRHLRGRTATLSSWLPSSLFWTSYVQDRVRGFDQSCCTILEFLVHPGRRCSFQVEYW